MTGRSYDQTIMNIHADRLAPAGFDDQVEQRLWERIAVVIRPEGLGDLRSPCRLRAAGNKAVRMGGRTQINYF
jgi:hypothetical protein